MPALAHAVPAGEFKAKCLQLMDRVNTHHTSFVITKRGIPVARLVPIEKLKKPRRFGCMAGTIRIQGDITIPLDEKWKEHL